MQRVYGVRSFFTAPIMLAVFVAGLWFGAPSVSFAAGQEGRAPGKAIVIKSPADGDVIRGTSVDVIFELRNKGARGDHVHLYLDGRLVKPLYGRKVVYTLNRLSHGSHSIVIRLATKRHQILKPQDSVTIEVK